MASHKQTAKTASVASHKQTSEPQSVASHKTVKVTASIGNGQKSKTIKYNGLALRVRLSDRGYRVMLLASGAGQRREPYLVSLRRSEWAAVENDNAAFLHLVKEKLTERIARAEDGDRAKLESLLQQIKEATK